MNALAAHYITDEQLSTYLSKFEMEEHETASTLLMDYLQTVLLTHVLRNLHSESERVSLLKLVADPNQNDTIVSWIENRITDADKVLLELTQRSILKLIQTIQHTTK